MASVDPGPWILCHYMFANRLQIIAGDDGNGLKTGRSSALFNSLEILLLRRVLLRTRSYNTMTTVRTHGIHGDI